MDDIKPNSLEAVLTFAVYICAQDREVSTDEIVELLKASEILKNNFMFLEEYPSIGLKDFIEKKKKELFKTGEFLNKEISKDEENYYSNILTDDDAIDLAIRVARISASIDGLHKNENHKYKFWMNKWV